MKTGLLTLLVLLAFACGACKSKRPAGPGPSPTPAASPSPSASPQAEKTIPEKIFSSSVQTMKIRVFFEPGAEPYTGSLGLSGSSVWDITKASYQELFKQHPRVLDVPKQISEMTQIPAQNRNTWTYDSLSSLERAYAPPLQSGTSVTIDLFFLNGTFEGNTNILGVHYSGMVSAFVFKDIVRSVGGTPVQQKYVEQAVAVHELGHTVGLVKAGIPMKTPHEDAAHPAHTTNQDCVMYWAVESALNVMDFVSDLLGSPRLQLFGPQSLQDAQSFRP